MTGECQGLLFVDVRRSSPLRVLSSISRINTAAVCPPFCFEPASKEPELGPSTHSLARLLSTRGRRGGGGGGAPGRGPSRRCESGSDRHANLGTRVTSAALITRRYLCRRLQQQHPSAQSLCHLFNKFTLTRSTSAAPLPPCSSRPVKVQILEVVHHNGYNDFISRIIAPETLFFVTVKAVKCI